jgi:hypothetical protein
MHAHTEHHTYYHNICIHFPFLFVIGDLRVYNSEDWGDKKKLDKILIPKRLWIKVGCKVMLMKNLSDKLVNESIGTVRATADNYIDVEFSRISARIEKFTFGGEIFRFCILCTLPYDFDLLLKYSHMYCTFALETWRNVQSSISH